MDRINKFERTKEEFERTNDFRTIIKILRLRKFSRQFLLKNITKFTMHGNERERSVLIFTLLSTQNTTDSILEHLQPYFNLSQWNFWNFVFGNCNYSEEYFFKNLEHVQQRVNLYGSYDSLNKNWAVKYYYDVYQGNTWFYDTKNRSKRLTLFLMLEG